MVRIAPMPGMYMPSQLSGRSAFGSSSRLWSMLPISRFNTHTVMPSGTQISSPVMK